MSDLMMRHIGARIRAARKAKKLTQNDLAERLEESSGRIVSEWERGDTNITASKLMRVASVLQVSPDYLLLFEGNQVTLEPTEIVRVEKIRSVDDFGLAVIDAVIDGEYERCIHQAGTDSDAPEWKMLNLYAPPAAAGPGSPLWDDEPEPIRVELTPAARRADFAVRIVGNSMEPNFRDGDLVLVQHTPTLEPGQLGIFEVDGQAYFKQLGDGELLSLNRDCPDVPLSEESPGRVLGRVLGRAERIGE